MNTHVRYRINTPAVVGDVIDGEVVIVNLETGSYYSLQQSGAQVWKLIEAGASVEETTTLVAEATGASRDEVAGEVIAFIGELSKEQLVVPSSDPTPLATLPAVDHLNGLGAMVLERFDEMQEMLLYDPIHDVDETGWPNLPDTAPGSADNAAVRLPPNP